MTYKQRLADYKKYGYESGVEAADTTDWQPGEMEKAYEDDNLGEVAGQILDNWRQMAGTLYYDNLPESILSAFEERFHKGLKDRVKQIMKEKKCSEAT